MRALVVGGSGSGKSAFAERLSCDLSPSRTYIATMRPQGDEAQRRIDRHRSQRAGGGFTTVECASSLTPLLSGSQREGVVLMDDVGNLVANALFYDDGSMGEPARVLQRLRSETLALSEAYEHMVVVGNEVGSEGPYASAQTHAWVRLVGSLCCELACAFDVVVEVVSGVPLVVKGELT